MWALLPHVVASRIHELRGGIPPSHLWSAIVSVVSGPRAMAKDGGRPSKVLQIDENGLIDLVGPNFGDLEKKYSCMRLGGGSGSPPPLPCPRCREPRLKSQGRQTGAQVACCFWSAESADRITLALLPRSTSGTHRGPRAANRVRVHSATWERTSALVVVVSEPTPQADGPCFRSSFDRRVNDIDIDASWRAKLMRMQGTYLPGTGADIRH